MNVHYRKPEVLGGHQEKACHEFPSALRNGHRVGGSTRFLDTGVRVMGPGGARKLALPVGV